MTYTGAQSRLASGTAQPAHNARTERGSGRPRCANTAALRAISHRISVTPEVITAAIAATLASTPSQSAAMATIEFSNVLRFVTNSTYRTTYTRAAAQSTSTLRNSVMRTIGADGPVCVGFSAAVGADSVRSAKPQRGITA